MIRRITPLVGLLVGLAWPAPRGCHGGQRPGVAALSVPRGDPERPVGPERRRGRSPGAGAGRRDAEDRPRRDLASAASALDEFRSRFNDLVTAARNLPDVPGDRVREVRRGRPRTASPDARPAPRHGRCRMRPRAARPRGLSATCIWAGFSRAWSTGPWPRPLRRAPRRPGRAPCGAVRPRRPGCVPRAVSDARARPARAPGRARRGLVGAPAAWGARIVLSCAMAAAPACAESRTSWSGAATPPSSVSRPSRW